MGMPLVWAAALIFALNLSVSVGDFVVSSSPYESLLATAGAVAENRDKSKETVEKYPCMPGRIYKISPGKDGSPAKVRVVEGNEKLFCIVERCDENEKNCKPVGARRAHSLEERTKSVGEEWLCPTIVNCDAERARISDEFTSNYIEQTARKVQPSGISSDMLFQEAAFPTIISESPAKPDAAQQKIEELANPTPELSFEERAAYVNWTLTDADKLRAEGVRRIVSNESVSSVPDEPSAQTTFGAQDDPAIVSADLEEEWFTRRNLGNWLHDGSKAVYDYTKSAAEAAVDFSKNAFGFTVGATQPLLNSGETRQSELSALEQEANQLGLEPSALQPSQDFLNRQHLGPLPELTPLTPAQVVEIERNTLELKHPSPPPPPPEPERHWAQVFLDWLLQPR